MTTLAAILLIASSAHATDVEHVWDPGTRHKSALAGQFGDYGRSIETGSTWYASRGGSVKVGHEAVTRLHLISVNGEFCRVRVYVADLETREERVLGEIDECSYSWGAEFDGIIVGFLGNFVTGLSANTNGFLWGGTWYEPYGYVADVGMVTGVGVAHQGTGDGVGWSSPTWWERVNPYWLHQDVIDADWDEVSCDQGYAETSVATGLVARFDDDDTLTGLKLICHETAFKHGTDLYTQDWWRMNRRYHGSSQLP
jgi:hypothetical protein